MSSPKAFYEKQIIFAQTELSSAKKKSLLIALSRLLLFFLTVGLAYFLKDHNLIFALVIIIGVVLFLILVSIYTNLKRKQKKYRLLLHLNENELNALSGNYAGFKTGYEYADPHHPFCQDMDLFGKGSLFQSINRAATLTGEIVLANLLKSNDTSKILAKQNAIKDLAEKPLWRQDFWVNAKLIETDTDAGLIIDWIKNYKSQFPTFIKSLTLIFSIASLLLFVLAFFSVVGWGILIIPLLLGLLITGVFIHKVNKVNQTATKITATFMQYAILLRAIENENYASEILAEKQQGIIVDGKSASQVFQELGKYLSALDQRNNIFFALFANGYSLWDLRYAKQIENWIIRNREMVEICFKTIAFFDAYNALANYSFNHPEFTFPVISDNKSVVIKSHQLGHPLLKSNKRIDNDFEINSDQFFIITGANMAGKSTFLRTVGCSIIMANCGLPICAKSFHYNPIKLISSMRSSDSLQDDESYFFAELKRLKYIVDEISNQNYFIILDEILKGTNSKDKEEGSKKFVERLAHSKSTGIIATHDLSLCTLEDELPENIRNFYFDASILNDELSFDYRLKNGICKNMNASFLLKKMGIVN